MAFRNHLADETSPYLLQHANNPVDWYPWGEEALEKAKQENKPILLSIGYAACHWCHVMAHESFMDEETAQIMNQNFINIKVDKEERPDLDKIYQTTHQMLTGRPGGWPLTVFMMPDSHIPFFAGTYFPPESRFNMPGFRELLEYIARFYLEHPQDIIKQNQTVMQAIKQFTEGNVSHTQTLNIIPLQQTRQEIATDYDRQNGGFGTAPKFPHPGYIEQLLRYWSVQHKDEIALQMAAHTLTKMALGGIYDQIGGGFYRYSIDENWSIPHFEKMLYDNALLLWEYTQAYLLTRQPLFEKVALNTAYWVLQHMQAQQGGYYATLDADSEGEEGKFYLWNLQQINELLSIDELAVVNLHYNLKQSANVANQWHLHVVDSLETIAQKLNKSLTEIQALLESAKTKMLRVREQRIHPGRDEKILVAWNALMIKAMILVGRCFHQPDLIQSAQSALKFIYERLWKNSELMVGYKDGRAQLPAYLDDYAFLLDAILTYLQYKWDSDYLLFACKLADKLLENFQDKNLGGFFFTADTHEKLLYRPKHFEDDALPSGNGIAASALQDLGYLLNDQRYILAAEGTLKAAWPALQKYPSAHSTLLLALAEYLQPPQVIVICGKADEIASWQEICEANYDSSRLVFAIPTDAATDLPEALKIKTRVDRTTAYVCSGQRCLPPITDKDEFSNAIR